ncbi:hypothetical protein W97_05366 [Coniosporium apollinis CBS 100218]|uniref:N-acetyltransferase domain-containing protein n=1 Tax=Coniosporium apollinis (strain CBS 100218) TaxID=1168221 RepID=R7YWB9_CONA1|nr:uncharacterized protein W97_05366 [Coniosporium apollinis CBS 100218]EON66123.1 hypothetical protein W97_05366 [Coniosporium apollinis CBS 100218]
MQVTVRTASTNTIQFIYRLSVCGELSLGLFTTTQTVENSSNADLASGPTASSALPVDSNQPDRTSRRELLLGHIVATKTTNPTIHDDDMVIPPNWPSAPPSHSQCQGHQEHGRTVALHSLAVLPAYQRKGLGALLLKAYVQRIESSGIADRVALLTYDRLVPFYETLGFENRGRSAVTYGGGGWIDMVREFRKAGDGEEGV